MDPISLDNTEEIQETDLEIIDRHMSQNGFCLFNFEVNDKRLLLDLAKNFGEIQLHIRADKKGIVGTTQYTDHSWKDHPQEYQGVSTRKFSPHTDGTFINGMYMENNRFVKLGPPKYLILQCIKNSSQGGESIIVDGKKILEDLIHQNPDILKILFKEGSANFCRDDQIALNQSIFSIKDDNSIRIRFRYDDKLFLPDWSYSQVKELNDKYFNNPKYHKMVNLSPGDTILIDNYRMLHGRKAFKGKRKLHRVWIGDSSPEFLYSPELKSLSPRAMKIFDNYKILDDDKQKKIDIKSGIILEKGLQENLKEILSAEREDTMVRNSKIESQIAVLYQETPPPVIDGIRKPKKPGGYSDSGADIAFMLKKAGHNIVTPIDSPDPTSDKDWVFPDTKEGIQEALSKGATTLWANTVLFETHPINNLDAPGINIVGQPPSLVQKYDDKWHANSLLKTSELSVAPSILISDANILNHEMLEENNLSFPLIIKPIRGRGSQGVKKIDTLKELQKSVNMLLSETISMNKEKYTKYGHALILEQYFPETEVTFTVMPPGKYKINNQDVSKNDYWSLPAVTRFNHELGIAPYNGIVAVMRNSRIMTDEECNNPNIIKISQECEKAAKLIHAKAPIRIDCRANKEGRFFMFDVNMKPNMTGAGRPGRDQQDSLSCIAARKIGWSYTDLLENMLDQMWQMESGIEQFRNKIKNQPAKTKNMSLKEEHLKKTTKKESNINRPGNDTLNR